MNIAMVISIIENSSCHEWLRSVDLNHFTYKTDLCLRIEKTKSMIPVNSHWVKDFPNSHSYGLIYTVFYNSSFISEYEYICLDERVIIPLHAHVKFEKIDNNLTKIINDGNAMLSNYLKFFKISH